MKALVICLEGRDRGLCAFGEAASTNFFGVEFFFSSVWTREKEWCGVCFVFVFGKRMRPLTEDELKTVFTKLSK